MNWYKKTLSKNVKTAQEYVGADATLDSGQHIQDVKIRNTENSYLPPTVSNLPSGFEGEKLIRKTDKCEKCNMPLENFEWLGYGFTNSDGEKEEAYRCNNCGYKNHYTQQISRVKKHKRRRRARLISDLIKESATPSNPAIGDYNNPANTPYGRLDLSEDERVMTWKSLKDGFQNEFDSQKQKNNDEYEELIVHGKDGKRRRIRVKKRDTKGDAIQPTNTWTQKGRVKKQTRYNPKDPKKTKENPGAWPHNRNYAGPGSGWYQAPYGDNLDSDMRMRVNTWDEYINNRGQYSLSRPY